MLVLNAVFSVEGAVYQRSSDVKDIWDFTSRIGCRSPQKRVSWPCGDFVLWMCSMKSMRSWATWRVEVKNQWRVNLHTIPAFVVHEHLGYFMENWPRLQSWLPECGGILAPKLVAKKIQRVANPGRRYYHLGWAGSWVIHFIHVYIEIIWKCFGVSPGLLTIASLHHAGDVSETEIHNFPLNRAAGSPWKCRKLGGLKVTLQHILIGKFAQTRRHLDGRLV